MSTEAFFLSIQKEIEINRKAVGRLQKRWPDEIVPRASMYAFSSQRTIYDCYPYIFLKAFPSLTLADARSLTLAGRLFANSIFLYDEIMDCTSTVHLATTNVLFAQAMQFEAYYLLHQIFPSAAAFWKRFHSYVVDYANACIQEKRFASGDQLWQEYTEAQALHIAVGKSGIARTTIAGLVELSQDDSFLNPLTEAINYFNIAYQMFDDLCDWKVDLRSGIPSLLLSRVVHKWPLNSDQKTLIDQGKKFSYQIYYGGHAHYVLNLALENLNKADNLTAVIPNLEFRQFVEKLRNQCQQLLQDIDQIVQRNLLRVRQQPKFVLTIPSPQSKWQEIVSDGLTFIVQQWQLGFGEMRHILRFSGFNAAQEYQMGDVFQRSLVADALCDANKIFSGLLQPIIDHEVSYLLSCKNTDDVGGWSYFPNFSELPPDADDLAQVMQVLLQAGYEAEVKEHAETPLKVLFNDCAHANGSFETWIVPATKRTPQQKRQAELVKLAWGTGPDADVIANLLYALTLYDQTRFAKTIQKGVTYLESQQHKDGCWLSTWYHGPYYGTYVCLRLLAVVKPDSPAIQRALSFLRSNQHPDGGWGLEDKSDPLNTALSLLGLALVQKCSGELRDYHRAEQALKYLQLNQNHDKSWPNCQFIWMVVFRDTNQSTSGSYGSSTITTAFVMKAAVLWHQLVSSQSTKDGCNDLQY